MLSAVWTLRRLPLQGRQSTIPATHSFLQQLADAAYVPAFAGKLSD